jgi:hypothetical protein
MLLQAGFGDLGLKITSGRFHQVWASKPRSRVGSGTWRHRGVLIEGKLSHEGLTAIGCTDLHWDHFALGVKWFTQNILGKVWDCVITLEIRGEATQTSLSLQCFHFVSLDFSLPDLARACSE